VANGAAEDVRTANSDGWTPVYVVAADGHVKVLALLETLGATPDARVADRGGQTPFLAASGGGHLAACPYCFDQVLR
jgi:ankyrin repeat protein